VTGDLSEALALSDRIAVMYDGRIVASFYTDDEECVCRIPQMMAGLQTAV
jgi:simple sugar transport system ATP-binding protein